MVVMAIGVRVPLFAVLAMLLVSLAVALVAPLVAILLAASALVLARLRAQLPGARAALAALLVSAAIGFAAAGLTLGAAGRAVSLPAIGTGPTSDALGSAAFIAPFLAAGILLAHERSPTHRWMGVGGALAIVIGVVGAAVRAPTLSEIAPGQSPLRAIGLPAVALGAGLVAIFGALALLSVQVARRGRMRPSE